MPLRQLLALALVINLENENTRNTRTLCEYLIDSIYHDNVDGRFLRKIGKSKRARIFVRDGILSVADYNSTRMGVVVVVVVVVVVAIFTMG